MTFSPDPHSLLTHNGYSLFSQISFEEQKLNQRLVVFSAGHVEVDLPVPGLPGRAVPVPGALRGETQVHQQVREDLRLHAACFDTDSRRLRALQNARSPRQAKVLQVHLRLAEHLSRFNDGLLPIVKITAAKFFRVCRSQTQMRQNRTGVVLTRPPKLPVLQLGTSTRLPDSEKPNGSLGRRVASRSIYLFPLQSKPKVLSRAAFATRSQRMTL